MNVSRLMTDRMDRWMTLSDIAAAKLPGLPATPRGMAGRARAEGWDARPGQSRPRQGVGGGTEYSVELLPLDARVELARRSGDGCALAALTIPAADLREDDPLSGPERDRRDARLHVLAMFEAFRRATNAAVRDAIITFSSLYTGLKIAAPEWVRSSVPTLSKNTLLNWRALLRDHGPDALGIDRRGRPQILDRVADGQAKTSALAAIARQEFLSAGHLKDYLSERFHGQMPPSLSTRTVQRARARLESEHRNVLMKLRDPDGYRSKVRLSATNSTFSAGLNDLWQIDASPADVMLKGARRHSVYVAIDIWSRRVIVLVTSSARADAVAALMRKCLIAWGVPARVMTDQGSDFTARATARLMTALGIEHEICDAFDPARKGNVERAIKTFQHDLPVCPGFIGHNVADRKKIESRKAFSRRLGMAEEDLFDVDLDLVGFQTWCDQWAGTIYDRADHAGLRGKSPFLKAASWQGEVRRIAAPAALDVLLAPVAGGRGDGIRRVTKQGLKIDREYYQTAAAWPGEDVLIRMDPTDLGRVLVFRPDGETYLGEAICPPLAGLDPAEVTMRMKAAQKAHEQAALVEVRREMRQIGPRDFMEARLAQAERRSATVTRLERPGTPYTTPALDAAQEAAAAAAPDIPAYTPEQRAQAAVVAMPQRPAAPKTTPRDRFRRALALEDAVEAGSPIDADDEAWLRGYRLGAEYRGWMKVFEKQGHAMFAG